MTVSKYFRLLVFSALLGGLHSTSASAEPALPEGLPELKSDGAQVTSQKKLKVDEFGPLIKRRFVHGKNGMLAFWNIDKGGEVPWHSHESEQITHVITGKMTFTVGTDEKVFHLSAGDSLVIPSNVPHKALAIEDTYEVDVFSPIRTDWLDGSAGYLKNIDPSAKEKTAPEK